MYEYVQISAASCEFCCSWRVRIVRHIILSPNNLETLANVSYHETIENEIVINHRAGLATVLTKHIINYSSE